MKFDFTIFYDEIFDGPEDDITRIAHVVVHYAPNRDAALRRIIGNDQTDTNDFLLFVGAVKELGECDLNVRGRTNLHAKLTRGVGYLPGNKIKIVQIEEGDHRCGVPGDTIHFR